MILLGGTGPKKTPGGITRGLIVRQEQRYAFLHFKKGWNLI